LDLNFVVGDVAIGTG